MTENNMLMRYFCYFWVVFALYFIIAHPAIIYYNTSTSDGLADANPVLSMIYLLIVLVGWTVVFILGFRWAFRRTIGLRKQVNKLLSEGTLVHGKVARVVSVKSTAEGFEEKELIVHFNNFRKQPVSYPIVLMDRRPEQRRYEKGKPIQLRIDDTLKISPYIIVDAESVELKMKTAILYFGLWFLALVLFICCLVWVYQTESQGYGWRFLQLYHPLIISLGILLLFIGIWRFVIAKLTTAQIGQKDGKIAELIFYGERATAMVKNVSQTGVYINEQPQLKYEMYFTDSKGQRHDFSLKKVLGFLELDKARETSKQILYLPDTPSVVALVEDVLPE